MASEACPLPLHHGCGGPAGSAPGGPVGGASGKNTQLGTVLQSKSMITRRSLALSLIAGCVHSKFVSVYQTLQGCTRNMDKPPPFGGLSLELRHVVTVTTRAARSSTPPVK